VLVVEGKPDVAEQVRRMLAGDGFEVSVADHGSGALLHCATDEPDLVLLDPDLPGATGWEVLDGVRHGFGTPVIVLCGDAGEEVRARALERGADDSLTVPFSERELLARVHAVLRRTGLRVSGGRRIAFPGLAIDLDRRRVVSCGQDVELTTKEFDLLAFLAARPGHVLSREELLREVWGSSSQWQDPATVTEHVRRVRAKLHADSDAPWITTVRGAGYRFEPA
jgi:DNA-binding response OmpR family regulator